MTLEYSALIVDLGKAIESLSREHAEWSQATFGSDAKRGPIGPLRHLAKEAQEAAEKPGDIVEYADCLLLVLDASRRAGFKPMELLRATYAKLQVNKRRQWPTAPSDEPVEHIPTDGELKEHA